MYFEIKHAKTGKVLFSVGRKSVELTPEELKDARLKALEKFREYELQMLSGKPSSKVGRDIYLSKIGVFGFPFFVLDAAFGWLRGDRVWYSDDGVRHHTTMVRMK